MDIRVGQIGVGEYDVGGAGTMDIRVGQIGVGECGVGEDCALNNSVGKDASCEIDEIKKRAE